MGEIALAVRDLWKRFGSTIAVRGVNLVLKHGDFVSLLGPSGCGKTTVLRSIAGHLQPDAGVIELGGQDVTRIPAYRRNIGMVFQNYALFPHMSVWENVAFGLRMHKVPKRELRSRVEEALNMVHLADLGGRNPRELSGGQQQRVALARAIVIRPRLLLLDEPLSNLDAKLRKKMQVELRRLQESLGITTVHVTHDQEEALSLSDRVVILWEGRLEQEGSPAEIYRRPVSAFVADFVGKANLFQGRIVEREEKDRLVRVVLESGDLFEVRLDRALTDALPGSRIWFGIRPEAVRVLHASDGKTRANVMCAVVRRTVYGGSTTTTIFKTRSGLELVAEEQNVDTFQLSLRQGQEVEVHLPTEAAFLVNEQNRLHDAGEGDHGTGTKPDGGGNYGASAG